MAIQVNKEVSQNALYYKRMLVKRWSELVYLHFIN